MDRYFYVCCSSVDGEAAPGPGDVRATAAAAAAAAASDFLARACRVESGGRLRPRPMGNCWKLATCCKLCRSAAECSWAFLRSSATLEERWSAAAALECAVDWSSREPPIVDMGLMGQQEHSPGNATDKTQ
jgi:hypothetical protein